MDYLYYIIRYIVLNCYVLVFISVNIHFYKTPPDHVGHSLSLSLCCLVYSCVLSSVVIMQLFMILHLTVGLVFFCRGIVLICYMYLNADLWICFCIITFSYYVIQFFSVMYAVVAYNLYNLFISVYMCIPIITLWSMIFAQWTVVTGVII